MPLFWMLIKVLKDPAKAFGYLRLWLTETNLFLMDLRETITTFSGVVAPYMAPVGVIAITYDHLVNNGLMEWYFAVPVLITLELLGFSITELRLKIIAHNRKHTGTSVRKNEKTGVKKKYETGKAKRLPEGVATGLLVAYTIVVQVLVIAPSIHFGDVGFITLTKSFIANLSLLGSFSAGLRENYEAVRAEIEKERKKPKGSRKASETVETVRKPKDLRVTYESLSQNHQLVYWAYSKRPGATRKDVGTQLGGVSSQRVSQIVGDLKKKELVENVNGAVTVAAIDKVEPIPVWE